MFASWIGRPPTTVVSGVGELFGSEAQYRRVERLEREVMELRARVVQLQRADEMGSVAELGRSYGRYGFRVSHKEKGVTSPLLAKVSRR